MLHQKNGSGNSHTVIFIETFVSKFRTVRDTTLNREYIEYQTQVEKEIQQLIFEKHFVL